MMVAASGKATSAIGYDKEDVGREYNKSYLCTCTL
jgi:hypothetical protein